MNDIKAIMLVGGLGTRLRPVVSSKPKVLASIGERSFLELLVCHLRSQGIRQFVMCTGYLSDQIESKFGDGTSWNISIQYSKEKGPLGTAGALKLAQRYVENDAEVLVLNGDSFLEIDVKDLMEFHRAHSHAMATISMVRVEDAGRYGTVQVDSHGRIQAFMEKTGNNAPGLINAGVYVFNHVIWDFIPEGPSSLEREVFPCVVNQGLYARQQYGMFIDIGTPSDYARAQELLRSL